MTLPLPVLEISDSMLGSVDTRAAVEVWMYAVSLGILLGVVVGICWPAAEVGVAAKGVGGADSPPMVESGVDWRDEERRSRAACLAEEPFFDAGAMLGMW